MSFIVSVIAAPGSKAITAAVIAQLNLANGRWLAAHEAYEGEGDEPLASLRQRLCHLPLDINHLPATNRRKGILLADMDSTMIDQECIDELGEVAGQGAAIKAITARAMRGEIDFAGALQERVSLLAGLDVGVIDQILRERITYAAGSATLLATMNRAGASTALVSGGFTLFTEKVAQHLGFAMNRANRLLVENGKLAGKVALPVLGKEAKVDVLNQLITAQGLAADDVIAVGDGANDIPMLRAAGLGVALHAKPVVQEQAPLVINHGDLTALLYLQGYSADEFVVA